MINNVSLKPIAFEEEETDCQQQSLEARLKRVVDFSLKF
jgi:hypothetical protein